MSHRSRPSENDTGAPRDAAKALASLRKKQELLAEKFGIGKHARFEADLPRGTLTFFDHDGPALEARVLPLGSLSSRDGSWLWAWANESLPKRLRSDAEPLRELAKKTKLAVFDVPAFVASADVLNYMLARSCQELDAKGFYAYAGPSESRLFLALLDVKSV